jgi:hypothetical protein
MFRIEDPAMVDLACRHGRRNSHRRKRTGNLRLGGCYRAATTAPAIGEFAGAQHTVKLKSSLRPA